MRTPVLTNKSLASSFNKMEEASESLSQEMQNLREQTLSESSQLDDLQDRINALSKRFGGPVILRNSDRRPDLKTEETPSVIKDALSDCDVEFRIDNLSDIDIAVSCIAGGIGVLVDFLVVKIPKSTNIIRERKSIHQEGSPLTEWMRKIGFDKDGKTSKWVKALEDFFGVNYDTSVIKGEKGLYPKSHRIYSLAHDTSPSGLLWAIKDMACGTFSYIDQSGKLKIIPAESNSLYKILLSPIIWIGHIISDIFTKAGVPIPGSCLLRTLQVGSFGTQKRTLGRVIEYMYLEGYDLRHLATMSTVNACVELIIRLYHILTKPRIEQFARPTAMIQADKVMLQHKLRKMRLCGYAVAAMGNLAKFAIYQLNPTSLNAPMWLALARASLAEFEYQMSFTKEVIDVMEYRQELEQNFNRIQQKLSVL